MKNDERKPLLGRPNTQAEIEQAAFYHQYAITPDPRSGEEYLDVSPKVCVMVFCDGVCVCVQWHDRA
jgi:hypothetical protein